MRMNMTMSMRFSKNLRRGLHATPHRRSTECARRTAVSPRQGALAGRFRLIEKTVVLTRYTPPPERAERHYTLFLKVPSIYLVRGAKLNNNNRAP